MQTFSPTKVVSFVTVTEPLLSKEPLGGASPSIQAGELHSPFINMLNLFSLSYIYIYIYIYFFLESPFSLPFLGQTSVQYALEATSSLESKGSEGACCSPLLCFLSFPYFFASP